MAKPHGFPGLNARAHRHPSKKRTIDAAREAELFLPLFMKKKVSIAVQRVIPREYFSRMRWFFEDHGCLRCRNKKSIYSGNGLCAYCRKRVSRLLIESVKRRSRPLRDKRQSTAKIPYLLRAEAADKLLRDLAQRGL